MTISQSATVREALEAIDRGRRQIAVVTDSCGRLLATVTDGDVRRGLLRGADLDTPVTEVMRTSFTSVNVTKGHAFALKLMRARGLHQMPMVDDAGRMVELALIDDMPDVKRLDTKVVLMAGGLGTRLRPITETVPKPMLHIGRTPILEVIIQNFIDQGFYDFTITLNYKGEMIRSHFGDGNRFNARIDYVEETKRMGTAGALSLLHPRPEDPFIVMNGDLLTSLPFDALVRFHNESDGSATMCARNYSVQVPYGVIEFEDSMLQRVVEKPTYSHFVNAGIYVLSPEALNHVEANEMLDMPTLFERIIRGGSKASVFPIQEYWMDIGRHEDLERAREEYQQIFQSTNSGLVEE